MEPMKDREKRLLDYLKAAIRKKGYPPTVREICAELGIKSTSTVFKDINSLEAKGYIRKDPAHSRSLEVLDLEGDEFGHYPSAGREAVRNDRADVEEIPVVGRIAAGTPILAEQNIEDSFPVPSRYLRGNGNHFMLTVHGESMIDAGIFDGDYILVQEQKEAANGEIVVAMIEGDYEAESTVKTFYRENGHIRLQPQNPTMDPIIVDDCEILGVVKGVFRYFN